MTPLHPRTAQRYTVAFVTGPDTSLAAIAKVSAALAAVSTRHGFRIDEIHAHMSGSPATLPSAARSADAILAAEPCLSEHFVGASGPPLFFPLDVPGPDAETRAAALLLAAVVLLRGGLNQPAAAEALASRMADASWQPVGTPGIALSGSLRGNSRELTDVRLALLPSARRGPTIALGGSA